MKGVSVARLLALGGCSILQGCSVRWLVRKERIPFRVLRRYVSDATATQLRDASAVMPVHFFVWASVFVNNILVVTIRYIFVKSIFYLRSRSLVQ